MLVTLLRLGEVIIARLWIQNVQTQYYSLAGHNCSQVSSTLWISHFKNGGPRSLPKREIRRYPGRGSSPWKKYYWLRTSSFKLQVWPHPRYALGRAIQPHDSIVKFANGLARVYCHSIIVLVDNVATSAATFPLYDGRKTAKVRDRTWIAQFEVSSWYLALSCSISQPGDSFLDGLLVVKVFSILFGSHRRDICHNQIHLALRSHTSRCTIHSIYTVHRTLPSRCHYQWTTSWPATEIWTTYTTPCRLGSPVDLIYQREELSLTRQPEIKKANLNNTLKCEKVVFLWSYWEGYIYPKKQGTSQITGARLLFFPVLDND